MSNYNEILTIVDEVTHYAQKNDFAGFCKHDALNSPFLSAISFNNRFLRLLYIQAVMRFPVNLRPLFFTVKSRNPKGIAIFARGYLLLYSVTKNEKYRTLAVELLNWLEENHSNKDNKYNGICWGYNFPWQTPFFYAPRYFPNLTLTVFPGEAFILAYQILKKEKYLDIAISAADFLLKDLPVLHHNNNELCLGYVPANVKEKVININSMTAAFLSKLYKFTGTESYKENAIKLINFVVNNSVDSIKWTYTTNIKSSYVDNYHTGGIIDEILETMENLNYWTWKEILIKSCNYYRSNLFTPEGAPKNRDNQVYPFDIHGAAQGIITFSKMTRIVPDYIEQAQLIYSWTMNNLYSGEGYFYYQKTKYYTKKFTLMRWCNAWMLYALGEYLFALKYLKTKKL